MALFLEDLAAADRGRTVNLDLKKDWVKFQTAMIALADPPAFLSVARLRRQP